MRDKKTLTFNSIEELNTYLKQGSVKGIGVINSHEPGFIDYTWNETIEALVKGWPKGSADIAFSASILSDAMTEDATSIEYDVAGEYVDVGVYLSGVPECMGTFAIKQSPKKEISIIINTSVWVDVPQEFIVNRGAVITALIDKLSKNYHVSLQYVNNGNDIDFVFNLDMHEGYSRDVAAFFSAHPGVLRRIIFGCREIEGFHRSSGVREWDKDKMKPTDIYFPSMNNENLNWFQSIESSKNFIEQVIAKMTQNINSID